MATGLILVMHGVPELVIVCYLQEWTPLHYAVYRRSNDMARVLVDAGADVNAKDAKVCTVLLLSNMLHVNGTHLQQLARVSASLLIAIASELSDLVPKY